MKHIRTLIFNFLIFYQFGIIKTFKDNLQFFFWGIWKCFDTEYFILISFSRFHSRILLLIQIEYCLFSCYNHFRLTSAQRQDVFSGTPLGIFTLEDGEKKSLTNTVAWDYLYQRDSRLIVTHSPANIFVQLTLWTEQGKIWKFLIDNEEGKIYDSNMFHDWILDSLKIRSLCNYLWKMCPSLTRTLKILF